MAIVFKTPLNTKNLTTKESQNIDSPIGCNLEAGSVEYNENGEYTLEPESADGFSSVEITVDVPSNVNNQEKSVTISANGTSTITYDANYTGLSSVGITVDVEPDLEAKTVEYTANNTYTIAPSSGKDGISSATVTVNVDTVTPYNEGKAAGIAEQKAKLESATFVSNGTYTKEDGYNSVTVAVPSDINNQNKTATPTTSAQEITADSGYSGLGKVTISAVTAAIDSDIVAGNIKKDVEILGVTGTYDPQPELQDKTVTPSTSQQVISADSGYDGLDEVTVSAVTSSIDANIVAGNIKDGVSILGVTGNYTGSGGCAYPDWSIIGYTCSDLDGSGLDEYLTGQSDLAGQRGIFALKSVATNYTSYGPFYNRTSLFITPDLITVTGNGTTYPYMFQNCPIYYANVTRENKTGTSAEYMFANCGNLKSASVDLQGVTSVAHMFQSIAHPFTFTFTNDTGVTDMSYMFNGVKGNNQNKFVVSSLNTSSVTSMSSMFEGSDYIDDFSNAWDTSNVLSMNGMFKNANNIGANVLTKMASWDTSSVTDMDGMFYTNKYSGIRSAPALDTSNVTTMESMFSASDTNRSSLLNFDVTYDCSKVRNITYMFDNQSKLATFNGSLSRLGEGFDSQGFSSSHTLDLSSTTSLSKASLMNIINGLGTTSVSNAALKLSATCYALLDASDIAIATAKNWAVTSA